MSYSFQILNNDPALGFSRPLAINNAGTIAGYFQSVMGLSKGYTLSPPYEASNYTNENFPNSTQSQVMGLNNLGLTVGTGDGMKFAFVDDQNTFTKVTAPGIKFGPINFPPQTTHLSSVNDQGLAAGYGFYTILASSQFRSFIYDTTKATFTPVAGPSGAETVIATAINNAGTICGFFTTMGGPEDGFIETAPGQYTVLTGPETGDALIRPLALNNEGQVVGAYTGTDLRDHGFVYDIATKSYTAIDIGAGTNATGINDLGQIAGSGVNATGTIEGFVASIPSTTATIHSPVAGSTIEVPAGYGGVILGGTADVTLQDFFAGGALLQANAGDDTLITAVGNDTLVGGAGNDTLNGAAGSNTTFRDGGGNASMVGGNGNDQFIGTTGNDTITTGTGSNRITPGTGADLINAQGALDVVFPGGADTIFAFGHVLTAVGTGQLVLVNGANQATVLGGNSGSALIAGGPGGGLFAGGTGGLNVIVGGAGASTIFGSSGNDLLAAGGANPDLLIAGSGNETLTGIGSTGNNVFYAGAANDLMGGGAGNETFFASHGNSTVIGGSGADLYAFVNNLFAGGKETIFGFNTAKGDLVSLQGYAPNEVQNDLANQQNIAGSTILTLSDHTQITLVGIASLNASAFT